MKVEEILVSKIKKNPYQTRKTTDEKSLKALIKSIRENGLINPINIIKQDNEYIILSGHRRFECYKRMRRKTIPCIVRIGKAGDLKINMAHENLLRDDLQPLEKANTIKLLIADKIKTTKDDPIRMCQLIGKLKNWKRRGDCKFEKLDGFDDDDIFRMKSVLTSLNVSENNAVMYLSILSLPRKIQDAILWRKGQIIEEGKIKLTQAEQLTRIKNREYQDYLFNRCILSKLPRERLRALIDNHIKEVASGGFKGIYAPAQVGKLKSELGKLGDLQKNITSTCKKICSFRITTLQKLKETLEEREFLSEVGRLKRELLQTLHQINEQFEEYGVRESEQTSTIFNIEVANQNRFRNGHKIKGGKRFSFPREISNELNLGDRSIIKMKVIEVKDISDGREEKNA